MPYCPKCDMEFVEGITVCSDCGGPLVESKEVADAMKKAEAEKREEEMRQKYEELMKEAGTETGNGEEEASRKQKSAASSGTYVNKEQRYEDVSSSATAFFIVGGVLAAASVLCFTGIVNLPMYGVSKLIFQGVMVVMAVGSLVIAFRSGKSAGELKSQIADEQKETEEIIQWFTDSWSGDDLDAQILSEEQGLGEEEMSLKRFELIQDHLITGRDLPDQAYVDALCDMIYSRLYEK